MPPSAAYWPGGDGDWIELDVPAGGCTLYGLLPGAGKEKAAMAAPPAPRDGCGYVNLYQHVSRQDNGADLISSSAAPVECQHGFALNSSHAHIHRFS